jgi:predicted AAA+ superfamily ATPase
MVPFTPNITNLSAAIEIGRHILVKYLYLLDKAGVILCITEPNQTLQTLAKPQKVYLENTNIIHSLILWHFKISTQAMCGKLFLPISCVQNTKSIQQKTAILQLTKI